MAITNIEPKTSKVTGGVIIDIFGSDFIEEAFTIKPETLNIVNTSTTQSILEDKVSGLSLQVPEVLNQRASFKINQIFPEAFKIKVKYKITALSTPIIKNANLIGIELQNLDNLANKIRCFITYNQAKGYQAVIEERVGTTIIYRKEEFVNPLNISEIGVDVCGKYIHFFNIVNNHEIYLLSSNELDISSYSIEIFAETPTQGVPMNSEVIVEEIKAINSVSYAGYPAKIINYSDTAIRVRTTPGEVGLGDLILAKANLTLLPVRDVVRYVLSNHVGTISKIFDTVQAIVVEYTNPSREELFKNQEGFQWDENYILPEEGKNKALSVPTLWDPTTGNIPKDFFQSGVGPYDAIKISEIEKYKVEDTERWFAKVKHGTYYIHNVPYYLFSDESIIEYLGEDKTDDGRSKKNLLYKPKIGIPIAAYSLTEEKETKITLQGKRISKKGSFTGKILNGVELNTENLDNVDTTKDEFIVKLNSNNEIKNWIIPVEAEPYVGIYKFQLPELPLKDFELIFSRTDIFRNKKSKASKYGEARYSEFLYGEGVEEFGDYSIDYLTGEVEVKLEYLYQDLGVLSYVYDYPAVLEFNKDFSSDRGTWITTPTFSDLETLDYVGTSNGRPHQEFRLSEFPIIDKSSFLEADNYNFKLFLYDQYSNEFDEDWKRVINLKDYSSTDKVYEVDYANGVVLFGDNINGMVPQKYLDIYTAYKPTIQIQYEPESSNDYWLGKTTDLNLTKQNLSNGFLFLNRKKFVPSQIVVEFASKNITVFETTDISATVYTQDGETIPGLKVNFELLNTAGNFKDQDLITNPDGYVSTIYTPSSRLEDMGIKVDLYEPGDSPSEKGNEIINTYGSRGGVTYSSLKTQEPINGELDDILIFQIIDDGDHFLPYNNQTRQGGRLVLWHNPRPIAQPVRPNYIAGTIIGFDQQLPQPFDEYAPNYNPNLRGFYIVAKKTIQARAFLEYNENIIYSNIVSLLVEYSDIQKGTWTLPTPPFDYESSQINTATYIDINV